MGSTRVCCFVLWYAVGFGENEEWREKGKRVRNPVAATEKREKQKYYFQRWCQGGSMLGRHEGNNTPGTQRWSRVLRTVLVLEAPKR